MVDAKARERLKKGVKAGNRWMERNNYSAEPDLSHAQLRNANLKGYELISANRLEAPQTAHMLVEVLKGG